MLHDDDGMSALSLRVNREEKEHFFEQKEHKPAICFVYLVGPMIKREEYHAVYIFLRLTHPLPIVYSQ